MIQKLKNLHLTGIQFAGISEKLRKYPILKIEKVHRGLIIRLSGEVKKR